MNGEIAYIEAGSFQGNDGNTISYHEAIVNGRKYRFYGKRIAEKKVGDIIEFEVEEKGEGKTPKGKLKDEGGYKSGWQTKGKSPEELELERIKIRAMIMAYAKDLHVAGGESLPWSYTFPKMIDAVFGGVVTTTTTAAVKTTPTKEDVPDWPDVPEKDPFCDPPVKMESADSEPAKPEQIGAIYGQCAKLRCQPPVKVRAILKDPQKDINAINYGEAKKIILQLNKEVAAIGK